MVNIGLLGWFGGGNIGDEVMPYAIIPHILDIPKINKIYLFSRESWRVTDLMINWLNPSDQEYIELVPCHFHLIWNPLFFLELLSFIKQMKNKNINILLIGGGGLLKSYRLNKITPSSFMSQWLLRAFLAKLSGTKVIFFGVGVGHITSIIDKLLVKMVLPKVDLITVRDKDSRERLNTLGIKNTDITLTNDIAWLLADIKQKNCFIDIKSAFKKKDSLLVGICPRPLYQLTEKDAQLQNKLETALVNLSKFLIDKYNANILFFTLKPPNNDECVMIEKIYNEINEPNNCICMFSPYPPDKYIKISRQFDIMIGVKFHSLIFSSIAETPFIGISYDEKIDSLFDYMGLSEYKCNPYSDKLQIELITRTDKLIHNKERIKKYLSEKKLENKHETMKNLDILSKFINLESH